MDINNVERTVYSSSKLLIISVSSHLFSEDHAHTLRMTMQVKILYVGNISLQMIVPLYFKVMAFSKKCEQVRMRQMKIKQSFQNKISMKFQTFVPFGVKQSDVIEAAAVFNFL